MKYLVVENDDFMFQTRRERCKHTEHIKNTIEMDNVTICNTGNVTISVNGCFNLSIEELMCTFLCALILHGESINFLHLEEVH